MPRNISGIMSSNVTQMAQTMLPKFIKTTDGRKEGRRKYQ
jgi:hypothetical protein